VDGLKRLADLGDVAATAVANDDTLDAVVSALVAWLAASGRTVTPDSDEAERLAAVEGWIHLPSPWPCRTNASAPGGFAHSTETPALPHLAHTSVGSLAAMSMDKHRAIQFIAAVPEGFWTAYKDVANVAGSTPMAVGQWLLHSGGSIPSYWRVLNVDGEVPDTFLGGGSGPLDAISARDLLRREGVWIDADGVARQEQRFTVEDWSRLQTGGGVRQVRLPARPARAASSQPKPPRPGELRIGGTVRVREGSGEVNTWKIVYPDSGARGEGELSARSPIGKAILGHVAGEMVVVETRNGPRRLTIEQVV
jgi:transcription elongation GreA/GreB family factor/alkylated DNA nucleotide flippase Atl1